MNFCKIFRSNVRNICSNCVECRLVYRTPVAVDQTPFGQSALCRGVLTLGTDKRWHMAQDDHSADNSAEIYEFPQPEPGALSARQATILSTIIESVEQRGFPPSVRDLMQASGLASSASVSYQLSALEKYGYIRRGNNVARGIEVLLRPDGTPIDVVPAAALPAPAADDRNVAIPLYGEIAAGTGVVADDAVQDIVSLPRDLTGYGELFMLTVRGDSMVNLGIFDGDFVVVRRQPTAINGDVVAALLPDNEATVKTFKKVGNQVWLMPHNPDFAPIDGTEATIMGIVVTVLRKL